MRSTVDVEDMRILAAASMDRPEIWETATGEVAVFSRASPDRDGPNEDTAAVYILSQDACVLAVADGVGGLPAGQQASQIAIEELRRSLREASPTELRPAVLDGFETANRAVCDLGLGAATTLVVVTIHLRLLRSYHVGDSMALVTGGRGRIKHLTMAHSPVGYAVESGLLDEGEAMLHEDRHLVSNVLGRPEMHIDVGPRLRLAPLDTVVVGSDGLFDNLHVEEIAETARKGPLARAARELATECRARMLKPRQGHPSKLDDLTFLVHRLRR